MEGERRRARARVAGVFAKWKVLVTLSGGPRKPGQLGEDPVVRPGRSPGQRHGAAQAGSREGCEASVTCRVVG